MSKRRNHDAAFTALEALKGERTVSELASAYDLHLTMNHQWKKVRLEGAAGILSAGAKRLRRPRFPKTQSVTCMPRSESWLLRTIHMRKILSRAHNSSLVR